MMTLTLPDGFDHSLALRSLRSALNHHRLSHAYAWLSDDTPSLYQTALWLSARLNCHHPHDDAPCLSCRPCRWIAQNAHPEVMTISPVTYLEEESKKKTPVIDVKQAKHLLHQLSTVSTEGWRVVIFTSGLLCNAEDTPDASLVFPVGPLKGFMPFALSRETLKADVANRLLKTIEEPGDRTLFLFLTDAPQGLLPTVASRCQFLRFPSVAHRLGVSQPMEAIDNFDKTDNQLAMQTLLQQIVAGTDRANKAQDPEWIAMQWVKSYDSPQRVREQAQKLLLAFQKDIWLKHRPQGVFTDEASQRFNAIQQTLAHIELAKRQIHANVSVDAVLGALLSTLLYPEVSESFPRLSLEALDAL
ncbi:MAG: hypothetical protein VKK59_00220 [Vampirovibrionales bacterium]|nr:hypothetical protein [Vampirovibrionales bacterium]